MKNIGIPLCMVFTIFIFSCGLIFEPQKRDRIVVEIENKTGEDVMIYYYDDITWLIRVNHIIIKNNEKIQTHVYTNKIYYAEGNESKNEYGSKNFPSVPSNIDIPMYKWLIKE